MAGFTSDAPQITIISTSGTSRNWHVANSRDRNLSIRSTMSSWKRSKFSAVILVVEGTRAERSMRQTVRSVT